MISFSLPGTSACDAANAGHEAPPAAAIPKPVSRVVRTNSRREMSCDILDTQAEAARTIPEQSLRKQSQKAKRSALSFQAHADELSSGTNAISASSSPAFRSSCTLPLLARIILGGT